MLKIKLIWYQIEKQTGASGEHQNSWFEVATAIRHSPNFQPNGTYADAVPS
jgi:hypothetical protein